MKDLRVSKLKDYYGRLLTAKQYDAVEQYYDLDYSLMEIGENLAITRQAVHSTLRQAVDALEGYEKKLGFMVRDEKIFEQLSLLKKNETDEEKRRTIDIIVETVRS